MYIFFTIRTAWLGLSGSIENGIYKKKPCETHFFMGSGTGMRRRDPEAAAALGAPERMPGIGRADGLNGGGVVVLMRGSAAPLSEELGAAV